ncbi:MAG TPA: hypothetical protein VGF97_15705 [Rhizomicrobium sp.]|jgi:hypothetical protein
MDHSAADTPTIALAGRDWPVPRLTPRQNRVIVPILLDLIPRVVQARAQDGGDLAQLARFLDAATYDQLVTVAHLALTRAHAALTRDEFEEMPVETLELVMALGTIAKQAGLVRDRRDDHGG